MPVYNAGNHLAGAIDSMLCQSWKNLELIIINDGSKDKSADIIKSYTDKRIRFVDRANNCGLIATLNEGIKLTKSDFVARMDQDDVSLPERIEKQLHFLLDHPRIAAVGASYERIDNGQVVLHPVDSEEIKIQLLYRNPMVHPSMMLRKSYLEHHRLNYNEGAQNAEDYRLWTDMALQGLTLANLDEVLLKYRIHNGQMSSKFLGAQSKTADEIRWHYLSASLPGINWAGKELHLALMNESIGSLQTYFIAKTWVKSLLSENNHANFFDARLLENMLNDRLQNIAHQLYSRRIKPSLKDLVQVISDGYFRVYNKKYRSKKPLWKNILRLYV